MQPSMLPLCLWPSLPRLANAPMQLHAPVDDDDSLQRRARFERCALVIRGRLCVALQMGPRQHRAPPLQHLCRHGRGGGDTRSICCPA